MQQSTPIKWGQWVDGLDLPVDEVKKYIEVLTHHYDEKNETLWVGASNIYALTYFNEKGRASLEAFLGDHAPEIHVLVATKDELIANAAKNSKPRSHPVRGRPSSAIVEQGQLHLFELERRGHFKAYPITPNNEFPTLLTRLPIFVPGRASRQKDTLDQDLALPFETSWGAGRKFGPPLSVYDEDTLMALGRLRQNVLEGKPGKLPKPVSSRHTGSDEDVTVHVVYCMISDLEEMCGTSKGGRNRRLRLASIRRLAGTRIELTQRTPEGIIAGTTINLLDVNWEEYEENSRLYIQFSPHVADWLSNAYTYIDWSIRQELSNDVGKAIHRFLSGQPKTYTIMALKLKTTIGDTSRYNYFMTNLRDSLDQLVKLGWLEDFELSGNGRKVPHKLSIIR